MTAPLPVSPATVVEATKASSRVAAVVTTMLRLGAAGAPISADQVREWGKTLLQELYSQPPVRWEYRNKNDLGPGCWVTATSEHFYRAAKRGWVVRALWETPRVIQPEKIHDFQQRVCVRCGESEDWAGPDCFPPDRKVDPRTLLPFDPKWLVEPLEWLRDAPANLNAYDRRHRAAQAAFLLEKLQAHIEECNKP
ncbi:hypothetical protein ROV94_15660 [Stenotrophomonas maltophilia]|uniref:hypothetical protein n=1 Tax=Stenotrophomonas maltophilia TaxID=40324 RepID=UPI002894C98B|nr:hypothetical protein [Stenotrophomonas maltophilia]MDT3432304.1 hypothetical protein [Stenotrophomonas maltophilia]